MLKMKSWNVSVPFVILRFNCWSKRCFAINLTIKQNKKNKRNICKWSCFYTLTHFTISTNVLSQSPPQFPAPLQKMWLWWAKRTSLVPSLSTGSLPLRPMGRSQVNLFYILWSHRKIYSGDFLLLLTHKICKKTCNAVKYIDHNTNLTAR